MTKATKKKAIKHLEDILESVRLLQIIALSECHEDYYMVLERLYYKIQDKIDLLNSKL